MGHACSLLAVLSIAVMIGAHRVSAQEPGSPPRQEPAQPSSDGGVLEVGGRLVVSGETVVVTANPEAPLRDSSVATKISTPLIETPRSISVIDREMLDDLGAINLTQAHDYAVGMSVLDERGPAFARGFPVGFYDLRRDGLRTYSWSVREPVGVERVQYLRGPASLLYGDGSPGALINMVLKKPLPVRRYELGVSAGSLGLLRLTADMTGPLRADRRIRYRVVAAPEWLENGYDNDERRLTLMPMIAFDVGERGTLTVDMELYHQRGRSYRHVVPATPAAQGSDFSEFPWELNVNGPDYGWTGSNVSPGFRLDLPLGQRSSVHVAGRYTRIEGDINGQGLLGIAPDGLTVRRFQYHEVSTWDEYQSDTFATTTLRTGPVEHRLVGGVEAGLSTTDSQIGSALAAPLDLLNPVYGAEPEPPAMPVRYDIARFGLYATDQIRLGERLVVVPGLRWSHLGIEDHVATTGGAQSDEGVVSPSLGLVVLPRPWLSLYTNYARGFEPPVPGQYLEDGGALATARNRAIEGGIKADLMQRRMSLTAAVFRIGRTNVPEADPRGFYRQIGEAESRGLELEAVGSLAPGLGLRAGYSWTDTRITQDTSGFVGFDLPNAPRHKAEMWARYRFRDNLLSRLMVAGGAVRVSSQFTARDNVIVAPGFTRFDASSSYEIAGPRLGIALVVQNLTDRRHVTSGAGATLYAAPPRRLAVQLTSAY